MENIQIDSVVGCKFEGTVLGEATGTVVPASCAPPSEA